MLAVFLVETNSDHQSVLARERCDTVAVGAGYRGGHFVCVGILPAKDGRLRKHRDLRMLCGSLLARVFDPPKVALAVAFDNENLADRKPHVLGGSLLVRDSNPGKQRANCEQN